MSHSNTPFDDDKEKEPESTPKQKDSGWTRKESRKTRIDHVVDHLAPDRVHGTSIFNLFLRRVAIGKRDEQPNVVQKSESKSNIIHIKKETGKQNTANKETRQLQEILNALINNQEVTFSDPAKGEKLKVTIKNKKGGKKTYDLKKILQNTDWSAISFQQKDLDNYVNYIFYQDNDAVSQLFNPALPKRIDPATGTTAEKNVNPTQFACRLLLDIDPATALSNNPSLNAAYVIQDNKLYFVEKNAKPELVMERSLSPEEIEQIKNIKPNDLLKYMYNNFGHKDGINAKKVHWEKWYREQVENYKITHPDSRLDEWHFAQMLGMNIYTSQFYNYANRFFRGDSSLFTESELDFSGAPAINEIYHAITKSGNKNETINAIIKKLLLGTAMAQHGMHSHLESKKYVARRDRFSEELLKSKINDSPVLLFTFGEKPVDLTHPDNYEFLIKISQKNDDLPIIAKQGDSWYVFGLSRQGWGFSKLEDPAGLENIQFPPKNKITRLEPREIPSAVLEQIRKVHENPFSEKSIVSTALSSSSFITVHELTTSDGQRKNVLVVYENAEGVDVCPVSANQGENEFTLRPGNYTYERMGEIEGTEIWVGRQTRQLRQEMPEATSKPEPAKATSSMKEEQEKRKSQETQYHNHQDMHFLEQDFGHLLSSGHANMMHGNNPPRGFTTHDYKEALKKKDEFLSNKGNYSTQNPMEIVSDNSKRTPAALDMYTVIPSKHGDLESVTIHCDDKKGIRSETYFSNPAAWDKLFKSDRQVTPDKSAILSIHATLGETSIPNEHAMNFAAEQIRTFVENVRKNEIRAGLNNNDAINIYCKGATRIQAEALQIYTAWYANEIKRPIKFNISGITKKEEQDFILDEARLNRKVHVFDEHQKKITHQQKQAGLTLSSETETHHEGEGGGEGRKNR